MKVVFRLLGAEVEIRSKEAGEVSSLLKRFRNISEHNLLALGLFPLFVIIPGIVDEIIGVATLLVLSTIFVFYRKRLIAQRQKIEGALKRALEEGEISEAEAKEAFRDLNALTIGK